MWKTFSTLLMKVAQNVELVVIPLFIILQKTVQTQDKKKGKGLVKEEFQEAMKWLFVPLIQKDVQDRANARGETVSGKTMHAVIQEWTLKLRSCFELLKQGVWQSDMLNQTRKPAIKAKEAYDAAQDLADKAKATWVDAVSESTSTLSRSQAATEQWRRERTQQSYGSAVQAGKDAVAAMEKANAARLHQEQTQHAADLARARYNELQREYEKALQAYEPSKIPFFLMLDNCPSYSFFADQKQKVLLAICSILQVRVS